MRNKVIVIGLLIFSLFFAGCSIDEEKTDSEIVLDSTNEGVTDIEENDTFLNNDIIDVLDDVETNEHVHDYTPATCSEPQICSECGFIGEDSLGHNWKAASCDEPKTCTVCGEVDGKATGHNWKEANCIDPKTCITCGLVSGSVLNHNYLNGNCTYCGSKDPSYSDSGNMVWIPTNG